MSFMDYVLWVLVSCGSLLTMNIADDDTSPTLDPEPSPPSPCSVEHKPEPTADGEPKPAPANKPSPDRATEPRDAPELEPDTSDQVREPATVHATVDITVERESAEGSPAHCTTAEGEQKQDSEDLIHFYSDGGCAQTVNLS